MVGLTPLGFVAFTGKLSAPGPCLGWLIYGGV